MLNTRYQETTFYLFVPSEFMYGIGISPGGFIRIPGGILFSNVCSKESVFHMLIYHQHRTGKAIDLRGSSAISIYHFRSLL